MAWNPAGKTEEEILEHAKKLLRKTLRMLLGDVSYGKNAKGKLGQFVEKEYFGLTNNSDAEPDFKDVGIELKVSPLTLKKRGGLTPKERIVLGIINFDNLINEVWERSSFLSKNEKILLMLYLHEAGKEILDYVFKFIELFSIPKEDLEIIRNDWRLIQAKVADGKAHELSESDTFYLGACTKGVNANSTRSQPRSTLPAKQRAFCFKTAYVRSLIERFGRKEKMRAERLLSESDGGNIEAAIIERLSVFMDREQESLAKEFSLDTSKKPKNLLSLLVRRMLGVKKNKILEFEQAGITIKAICLEASGRLKESVSFPAFSFKDLAEEEWEDSDLSHQLDNQILFTVFQKRKDGTVVFRNSHLWGMSVKDRGEAERVWRIASDAAKRSEPASFPKIKDSYACHVRPHGRKEIDIDTLPNGSTFTKQCFWLNAKYVKEIVTLGLQ